MHTTRALYSRREPELRSFLELFPFASIRSRTMPVDVTCLGPLVLGEDGRMVIGHFDAHNPALEHLGGRTVTATFTGPNGYISPGDYSGTHYPTWNFSYAHLSGPCRLHHDPGEKRRLMELTIHILESGIGGDYALPHGNPEVSRMLAGVVFVTIGIETLQGVFKYSQEKPQMDCRLARTALLERGRQRQRQAFSSLFTPASQTET